MTDKSNPERRKGRPKDAKGREYVAGIAIPSRCPICKSTERSAYTNTQICDTVGEENRMPYDTVIWRTCQCLKCGQWRRDRSKELRGDLLKS